MPSITIDPTALNEKESIVLGQLLKDSKTGSFFDTKQAITVKLVEDGKQVEYKVKLKLPLYKENEKNARVYLKQIGQGGEGKIYLAGTVKLDEQDRARYKEDAQHERVIKEFKPEIIPDFGFFSDAKSDAETDSKKYQVRQDKLSYLHAKSTVVSFESKNDYWVNVSMHKFPRKDLWEIITKESKLLTPEIRFEISRKFLEALKELHDAGIIHNDIKPHNVVVDIDYASNTVKSLKIIDIERSKLKDVEYIGSSTLTPGYTHPSSDVTDVKIDVYAAGIALLETWGVHSDLVQTPMEYKLKSNFIPSTKISDPALPSVIQTDLSNWIKGLTVEVTTSGNLEDSLEKIEKIELTYLLDKLQLEEKAVTEFCIAREVGKSMRNALKVNEKTLDLEKRLTNVEEIFNEGLKAIEKINSPFAVMQFTKMLAIDALRGCDDTVQIEQFLRKHVKLFKDNMGLLSQMNKTNATKFVKKMNKCLTLDDMIKFNELYTEKIQQLTLSNNNNQPPIKSDLKNAFLNEISQIKTYDELATVFYKIKNYEKILKVERDKLFSTVGKYGITETWQEIMKSFQQKALEVANKEVQHKLNVYKDTVNLGNEHQLEYLKEHLHEKYNKFFQEKSSRVFFTTPYMEEFNKILETNFIARPGFKNI